MKIAVFPGSFDPFTSGHKDVIRRGMNLFDRIIIAIGNNRKKQYLFSLDQRKRFIETIFPSGEKVHVEPFETLTATFCKEHNATYILRGLRNLMDFEYEKSLCYVNSQLNPDLEHVFLLTSPKYAVVSSSVVRDIVMSKGDLSFLVPKTIAQMLYSEMPEQ